MTERVASTVASSSPSGSSSVASTSTLPQQVQQVGMRQGTRSRSRTARKASGTNAAPLPQPPPSGMGHPHPRYTSEDHPLSAHNLAARGYHSFTCLGVPFHVPRRYKFLRELGIGAYGCVALARDEELDMNVAIKKVTRIFERDVLARRALREVAILRHMLKNQNCTALIDFDTTFIDFSEIYLILSASEADLSQIIRSGQTLSDAHLQYFAAQLLRGVRYMHAANIIHRDLKPGNLLVNADCALFICDFGLARAFADDASSSQWSSGPSGVKMQERRCEISNEPPNVDREPSSSSSNASIADSDCPGKPEMTESAVLEAKPQSLPRTSTTGANPKLSKIRTTRLMFPGGPLTEYVSTRWYRSPEIMLGFTEGYGPGIDMWSVGCILAELACGKPLFDGKDYVDQIARIHGVLGPPSQSVLDRISSERAKVYVESLPKDSPPMPLSKIIKSAAPGLVDLLEHLLVWDPDKRFTAEQALRHPWLSAYHGIIDQWDKPDPFNKFDEIEFIDSLSEFRGALQTEADEVKGEYAALFGNGEDEPTSSTGSATPEYSDDGGNIGTRAGHRGIKPMNTARPADAGSSSVRQDSTPSAQAAPGTEELTEEGNEHDRDVVRAEQMESHKSSSSSSSATSSLAGSSSNLTAMRRVGESSSEGGSTTDTCSPLTSVGESAFLSSSSENSNFSSSLVRPTGSLGKVTKQSSFSMTTVCSESSTAIGKATKQADASKESGTALSSSRPKASRTTSVFTSSSSPGTASATVPRYRRRAVSNAPRPVLSGTSDSDAAHGPRSLSPGGRRRDLKSSAAFPASQSVEMGILSLQGLNEEQLIVEGGSRQVDARSGPQSSSSSRSQHHHHIHTPSPDFRSFTNDLIARPRFESGAFGSAALDAGDEVLKTLVQKRSAAVLTAGERGGSVQRRGTAGTDSSDSTLGATN